MKKKVLLFVSLVSFIQVVYGFFIPSTLNSIFGFSVNNYVYNCIWFALSSISFYNYYHLKNKNLNT